jgi:predicted TIM-barrel fold metal-dependent hydrolase
MIVDVEQHASTPDHPMMARGASQSGLYCERFRAEDGKMKVRTYASSAGSQERLQFMDEAGIDMAVLSTNPLQPPDQAQKWHEHYTRLVQQQPGRLAGLATIPPLGGQPALTELKRAVHDLGMKGVHICTRNEGLHLDSREMWPFYEKCADLRLPIDVHVTLEPPGYEGIQAPYALSYVMARELDMITETFRLCLGGVLEDFPDLVFIMNHFGGGISALLERLDAYLEYAGPGCPGLYRDKPLISRPWRSYFNKLYFNMAGRELGIDTVKCALTNISPGKLMFGTDWPFNYDHAPQKAANYIQALNNLDLPRTDIEAMLGGTAARLFQLK